MNLSVFLSLYTIFLTPTKLTAGRIELDFGICTDRITSHLSFKEAVADVLVEGASGAGESFS
ncbi:MAG: hypothetical protein IJD51_04240 [Clostridia bacterium]|nr:hypothetical protein [Clostridia bacterium]